MTIFQLASGSGPAAERAAGIEYTFVARPADVPAEYDASAGTSLRFLVLTAIDGSQVEAALKALDEGKEGELLPGGMRRTRGQAEPVTARHFLTYRASESSTADGTSWIARIPRPVLLIRDEGEMIVQSFEPYMLLAAARAHGSLVPSITYVLLPNPRGPNPDGHFFGENRELLARTIMAWLREQHL